MITIGAQFDDAAGNPPPGMSRAEDANAQATCSRWWDDRGPAAQLSHELSGGMRQRAMIAMALALEPQVMILDEPTTALDVVTQREILEELMGLRDRLGFAALFITHDLSLLVELADEIVVMYAGRLMERAPAASLFRSPRLPYTYGLLHCFPPMHGERRPMEGIPGSPPICGPCPRAAHSTPAASGRCRNAVRRRRNSNRWRGRLGRRPAGCIAATRPFLPSWTFRIPRWGLQVSHAHRHERGAPG